MNLICVCVFYNPNYIHLLKLLARSISIKSKINKETTEILIMTSPSFQPIIQKELENFNLPVNYYLLNLNNILEAACARLSIFNYENINKYDKILYLDTDILINSDINVLFNLELSSEKIYVLEEGRLDTQDHGNQFFDFTKYDRNIPAFTSGIILFKNSDSIKTLFNNVESHDEN